MKIKLSQVTEIVTAYNKKQKYKLTEKDFIRDAKRYISAIKDNRMICSIGSVSASGMSRTIKFCEMAKCKKPYYKPYALLNFYQFFEMLEYTPVKNSDYFRIGGCGMDMIFHTNYTIIGTLYRLGFMDKVTADKLAQHTVSMM